MEQNSRFRSEMNTNTSRSSFKMQRKDSTVGEFDRFLTGSDDSDTLYHSA